MAPYSVFLLILVNAQCSFGLRNDAGVGVDDELSIDAQAVTTGELTSEGENGTSETRKMSKIGTQVDPCTCAVNQDIKFKHGGQEYVGKTVEKASCAYEKGYSLTVAAGGQAVIKGQDIMWCILTDMAHDTSNIGISPGSKVMLKDLTSQEYNGLKGEVMDFDSERTPAPGRYIVVLDDPQDDGSTLASHGINGASWKALKPPNVHLLQEAETRSLADQIADGPPCEDWGCFKVAEENFLFNAGKGCADPGVHCVGSDKPSTIEGCAFICGIHDKCRGFQSPNPTAGFHGWCMWFEMDPIRANGGADGSAVDVSYVKDDDL